MGLRAKMQGRLPRQRVWNLGRWGMATDVLAVVWSVIIAGLLLLFDATHAVVLYLAIVGVGILAYVGYHYLILMIDRVVNKMEINAVEFIDLLEEPVK